MQGRTWARFAITTLTAAVIAAPAYARPAADRTDGFSIGSSGDHDRDDRDRDHDDHDRREAHDRGYREGLRDGENDARHSRAFEIRINGRDRRDDEYRRGYEQGYRESYERARIVVVQPGVQPGPFPQRAPGIVFNRRLPRGYEEPAFARGYSDGYRKGADDGHDRDRYDPVRHDEYRDGDKGYYRDYGSKDAYKNNYRTGFRQGYEDGYRDGTSGRRY